MKIVEGFCYKGREVQIVMAAPELFWAVIDDHETVPAAPVMNKGSAKRAAKRKIDRDDAAQE